MTKGLKLAVAVRDDLAIWQKLNVTAFVTSGVASACPEVIGEGYLDACGRDYPALFAVPVRVFSGDRAALRRAFERGLSRDVVVSPYTDEMFWTMNDSDNRAAVAAVETPDLSLAGFAVAGEAKLVDKVFDKLKLHP